MRYAMVSDIHANLPAWNAVLTDIATHRIDRIICLGDLVGYGPYPAEVLQSVHSHVDAITMGNHDAAVCGKIDPIRFNPRAREMVIWTRTALGPQATEFLGTLPLMLTGPDFRCAHGDFSKPAAFRYIVEPQDALPSWEAVPETLLFVGHSHFPLIHVIGHSGIPHTVAAEDFVIETEKRYIVNAGSVGHPRDGDCRACYCIYDTDMQTVVWRRVSFDLDAYRTALIRAGLSVDHAPFLEADPRKRLVQTHEPIDFAPATNATEQAQGVTEVGEIAQVHRRLGRWKIGALACLVVALLATGVAWLASRHHPIALAFVRPEYALSPRILYPLDPARPNLLPEMPEARVGEVLPGWRYALQDGRVQSVNVSYTYRTVGIKVVSQLPDGVFRIESPMLNLTATRILKLRMRGRVRKSAGFVGTVTLAVDQFGDADAAGQPVNLGREQKDVRRKDADGWLSTQHTFDVRRSARALRFTVEGAGSGELEIADLVLEPASLSR
jgi:predicted phosphodiesterase